DRNDVAVILVDIDIRGLVDVSVLAGDAEILPELVAEIQPGDDLLVLARPQEARIRRIMPTRFICEAAIQGQVFAQALLRTDPEAIAVEAEPGCRLFVLQ